VLADREGLPASAVREQIEKVELRIRSGSSTNPIGLLRRLLRLQKAERAALFSAELAASMDVPAPHTPAPWSAAVMRRDEPERYVRILATPLPGVPPVDDDGFRELLGGDHDEQRIVELLDLAGKVRAGVEKSDKVGSEEQERERWVRMHAASLPAGEIEAVVDGWRFVDPVEREQLLELAERLRESSDDERSEVA
jgi:hypothetical protein